MLNTVAQELNLQKKMTMNFLPDSIVGQLE